MTRKMHVTLTVYAAAAWCPFTASNKRCSFSSAFPTSNGGGGCRWSCRWSTENAEGGEPRGESEKGVSAEVHHSVPRGRCGKPYQGVSEG
ncbi:uncharacterized protein [Embiotoca jacksoni]|uniref:uncharacterized protein isoform X3 n=1 Tax=Embiotoca jacksoni TaxID=100190 RepID=UPI003704A8A9